MIYIIILLAAIIIWAVYSYNSLVTLINRAKEAWADIDVQLKRRYDLIPNLVNIVKGYATHEREVFENVTKARSQSMNANNLEEKSNAEKTLTQALKSIFAIAEAYPDLKASNNFQTLQVELTDTEDKIQAARRFYNGNVRDLNTSIQKFPGNIIANLFHFGLMEYFEIEESEPAKNPVQVKF